jgi:hypothetical protein
MICRIIDSPFQQSAESLALHINDVQNQRLYVSMMCRIIHLHINNADSFQEKGEQKECHHATKPFN